MQKDELIIIACRYHY
ncbi:MAG TPA: hypothetical protein VGQ72_15625 [Pyrinomonadaceae bacterium]|nr:hypothetical protein [Pyrinomonadaceae bacterium]